MYANKTNRHDVTGIVTSLKSSTSLNSTVATGGGEGGGVSLRNVLNIRDFVDSVFLKVSSIAFLRLLLFLFDDPNLMEFETLSIGLLEDEEVPEIEVACVEDCGGINDVALAAFVEERNTFSLVLLVRELCVGIIGI